MLVRKRIRSPNAFFSPSWIRLVTYFCRYGGGCTYFFGAGLVSICADFTGFDVDFPEAGYTRIHKVFVFTEISRFSSASGFIRMYRVFAFAEIFGDRYSLVATTCLWTCFAVDFYPFTATAAYFVVCVSSFGVDFCIMFCNVAM